MNEQLLLKIIMSSLINFIHEKVDVLIPKYYNHVHFYLFANRPIHEAKFRKIIASLLNQDIISKSSNIIDLGAWIGDNAVPWAKMLDKHHGKVYAIDPSANNCNFIEHLISLNEIDNIDIYQYAISDKIELLKFDTSSIDHINFTTQKESNDEIYATTLDILFPDEKNLSFIHLDVESM